jgi:formiminoglutamase
MLSIDISALQAHYAPGATDSKVYGLTGEEACQLCWYAGLNDKLSSIGFYEYDADKDDDDHKTAFVVATMIWYFIEGYYHRKKEQNFRSNDFLKYVVAMQAEPETITFYKSKFSEKWWMEVPYPTGRKKYSRNSIVPCSYADYQLATNGDIPERYISTLAKLM